MIDLASRTAIVVPVRDEEASIIELFDSFEKLSLKPREIIIVDGGSQDATVPVIKKYMRSHNNLPYKLRLIELEDAFPGKARNIGIESSSARIIACTDAGGIVDPGWLKHLLAPFKKDSRLEVTVGNCLPYTKSPFEKYAFLINIKGLDKTKFAYLGAVSIAFLKEVWQKVGKYPDEIYPNEDKCFLIKLKKYGAKFFISDKAIARWRPRRNMKEFAVQYFSYGRADARFDFVPIAHILRIATYTLGLALVIMGIAHRILWIVCLLGLFLYLLGVTFRTCLQSRRVAAFLYVPLLLLVKDIAQIFGYIVGMVERICVPKYREIARNKFKVTNE
ncbi:MAG: glycosyltransferase [Candidatus Omnitrophica bacterium]|nr:glycosyltransferase [Candidatus Omnitrophota bacterium]